jgi:hypothetical protein
MGICKGCFTGKYPIKVNKKEVKKWYLMMKLKD